MISLLTMRLGNVTFRLCSKLRFKFMYKKYAVFSFHILNGPRLLNKNISFTTTFVGFHTTTVNNAKSFQEKENEYAHSVMESISDYGPSVLKCPLESSFICSLKSNTSVVDEFVKVTLENLTLRLSIEDSKFSHLISCLTAVLHSVSYDDILKIIHSLCLWPPAPKSYSPNFKLLWNRLDYECVGRLNQWNVNQKLLVADYWFCLRLSRISRYNSEIISNLLENFDSLTSSQVVQLMFYINLQREFPQKYLFVVEKKLMSVINSISAEELGIVCIAYFKTKSQISDSTILQSIIQHFINNLDKATTVTISGILKCLRKSLKPSIVYSCISLMHRSIPFLNKWDIPNSVHLALLSSECNVFHPLLLSAVTEKFAKEMQHARIKDCTKLLQCLSHFNYYPESDFHDIFYEEVNKKSRQVEIIDFPRDLIFSSLYYAYMGHFNYNLIAKVLDKTFVEDSCVKFPYIQHVFIELDYCIEIECRNYKGPRVDKTMYSVLEQRRGNMPFCSEENMHSRIIGNVFNSLRDILGNDKDVLIRHILPHLYSPDIIVRLCGKNSPSVSKICQAFSSAAIVTPPADEIWACFVICGSYAFAYKSKHLTGVTAMKLRQLQKLGYKVLFIPFYDFPFDRLQQISFLKQKLELLQKNNIQNFSTGKAVH